MDGGGRLLRSLGEAGDGFFPQTYPRFAGPFAILAGASALPAVPVRTRRMSRLKGAGKAPRRGWGVVLLTALFGATGLYGAIHGGEYQTFVEENGSVGDVLAKGLGFSLNTVEITGAKELTPAEILAGGDISPKNSLALLDPNALREKLKAMPLVKDATVRKLFPNDLAVTVVEREPVALWQNDGQVALIAADGVPIDRVRDTRFNELPFVVGTDANGRLKEYQALLSAAGELRDRIRAGILVGDRRWTLKMELGVQVELPEIGAEEALRRFAEVERQSKVLEKDVISLDLRIPGRITARLSEDAAAQRAAALAKKPKKASAT